MKLSIDNILIDHHTKTNEYSKTSWNCNKRKIYPLKHYRMASVEVGYPLSTFKGSKELIHSGRCAFLGK